MNERTSFLRNIMKKPMSYSLLQDSLYSKKRMSEVFKTFFDTDQSMSILDVGCGPGHLVKKLKFEDYTGVDIDADNIDYAQDRYGDYGQFICDSATSPAIYEKKYDRIFAKGVLHHLSDEEVLKFFVLASEHLKEGGKIVTLDGCYTEKQNFFAKWMLDHDRGSYVRWEKEYLDLAAVSCSNTVSTIRTDLMHIPYTLIILECR